MSKAEFAALAQLHALQLKALSVGLSEAELLRVRELQEDVLGSA